MNTRPRAEFARRMRGRDVTFAPLCLSPLMARIAEGAGFSAGYVSGGALGYEYAVSEALLTTTEVADATRRIVARSGLGIIVDGGVGFGDAVHVARTMWEIEATGAAAIEIEDQVAPKRVSHHRGIEHLVPLETMTAKIREAVSARRDPDFLIIARTGAVHNESFERALERGSAYRDAGADIIMLMPTDEAQMRAAARALDAPLAAIVSMDLKTAAAWSELGWTLIIDPFTAQVAATQVVRSLYESFARDGATGSDRREIMAQYRTLPELAGLDALYAIEDRTTEAGDG